MLGPTWSVRWHRFRLDGCLSGVFCNLGFGFLVWLSQPADLCHDIVCICVTEEIVPGILFILQHEVAEKRWERYFAG